MHEPAFSETELVSMYEELLAVQPRPETWDSAIVDPEAQQRADEAALMGIVRALYELEGPETIPSDTRAQYRSAINKLREIVGAVESVGSPQEILHDVPVLSPQEWISLVRTCVREQDGEAAETVVSLMKRSGAPELEEALNTTLDLYADRGDVGNTERFIATFIGQSPTERQRHLHIKAHLRSLPPKTFPSDALQVLHDYENRGLPAPMQTYTRAINHLFHIRSAMAEAQAWDLFAHMRYVAHPEPDAFLYTIMINACAPHVLEPQPARALDLWTEMTVDKGIEPTADAYTAVICACARSGQKAYVVEAFRLAKQMLDGHRDAYGNPAFRPNQKTFCALLEGAKRVGDLAKVRWILAEIISESLQAARGDLPSPVQVDDRIMVHVFHAYTAYKPPFKRSATLVVGDTPNAPSSSSSETAETTAPNRHESSGEVSPSLEAQEAADADSQPRVPQAPRASHFTTLLPQSNAEVLGEVQALFSRILNDASPSHTAPSPSAGADSTMPPAFENVRLTTPLLNAYLSAHYMHASFDDAVELYRTLFSKLGVEKNTWTYVDALERCGRARRGPERKFALQFAREVWQEWQPLEDAWRRGLPHPEGMDARMVERAYTAMIRILSLTGNLREGVELVRSFVARYPPDVVKQAAPKPELRSTRTALQGARPLVRLLTPVEVPDDRVPPLLSFQEVESLHHRLVAARDGESIRYLKWVCMSYAGALKRRKEAVLRAKPQPASSTGNADGEAEDA
ncbi:hypothetical protein C8Q77DRAFT_860489 [Trametes polyzona]|nr:hypothetical protein C8Q77DRAFT_860489 [Trametes polyzona]